MVPAPLPRRQAIAAGTMTAVSLLSGCSAISIGSTETRTELGTITVENADDASHTIHVAVEQNSELIHGSVHDLEGVSSPENEDDFGSIDSSVPDDSRWAGKKGDWTIHTRVDDDTEWNQHAIPTDDGADCHAVRLKIEDDTSVTDFTPDCGSWPPSVET